MSKDDFDEVRLLDDVSRFGQDGTLLVSSLGFITSSETKSAGSTFNSIFVLFNILDVFLHVIGKTALLLESARFKTGTDMVEEIVLSSFWLPLGDVREWNINGGSDDWDTVESLCFWLVFDTLNERIVLAWFANLNFSAPGSRGCFIVGYESTDAQLESEVIASRICKENKNANEWTKKVKT